MATKEEISEKLSRILVPGVGRSLTKMRLVREVELDDGRVKLILASTALPTQAKEWVEKKSREEVGGRRLTSYSTGAASSSPYRKR